jgi:hypothetical protein
LETRLGTGASEPHGQMMMMMMSHPRTDPCAPSAMLGTMSSSLARTGQRSMRFPGTGPSSRSYKWTQTRNLSECALWRKWKAAALTLFAWLISHQPTVLFSQNKPATSNQPEPASSTLLSDQTSTSHQSPANRTGWPEPDDRRGAHLSAHNHAHNSSVVCLQVSPIRRQPVLLATAKLHTHDAWCCASSAPLTARFYKRCSIRFIYYTTISLLCFFSEIYVLA